MNQISKLLGLTTVRLLAHKMDNFQGIRNFECQICNKSFGLKSDLNRHVKTVHENIKPFLFLICNESFRQKYNLPKHFKIFHRPFRRRQSHHHRPIRRHRQPQMLTYLITNWLDIIISTNRLATTTTTTTPHL